jgi:energy-converting hydrogenase A subunit M
MSDPAGAHIVKTFHEAIDILDGCEPQIRDLIETNLMDVAGINRTKVSDAMLTRDELTKKIVALRHHHIKAAFRHLREHLPSDI